MGVMTKEIIKAYTPYAVITKDVAMKAVNKVKAGIPVIVAQLKELRKLDMAKVKEVVKSTVAKVEIRLQELLETIKKDKNYLKVVVFVEKKLEELKKNPTFMKIKKEIELLVAKVEKFIKYKVEEIKNNPALIKMKEEAETKIAEAKTELTKAKELIKEKVAQLKKLINEKLDELKKNPSYLKVKAKVEEKIAELKQLVAQIQSNKYVVEFINTMKQLKTSATFTIDKLEENLKPYIIKAVASTKAEFTNAGKMANKAFIDFAENPEETFWVGFGVAKDSVITTYNKAKSVTKQQVIEAGKKVYHEARVFSKDLIEKCTDEWTKAAAKKIVKEVDVLINKMKEEFKKMKSEIKELPALMKKYYTEGLVKIKASVNKHFTNAEELMKKQIEAFKKYWETSALRAFVETPLWTDIATEIKNHELVALATEIKDMVAVKLVELKGKLVKVYNEQKVILEKKYAELKVKVEQKFAELKTKSVELYKKIVAKYHELIAKAHYFVEKTTIADIVAFAHKQYAEAMKKFEDLKVKVIALKEKYTEKAKLLIVKYEKKVNEIYKKIREKVMQEYKKVAVKVTEMYKKYRPIVEKEYKKLAELVNKKFNELKEQTILKYKELAAKTEEMYNNYKAKAIAVYGKALERWSHSIIRAKLIAFTKMSIKEALEAIKKLPSDIKNYITAKYKEVLAKVSKLLAKLMELYK